MENPETDSLWCVRAWHGSHLHLSTLIIAPALLACDLTVLKPVGKHLRTQPRQTNMYLMCWGFRGDSRQSSTKTLEASAKPGIHFCNGFSYFEMTSLLKRATVLSLYFRNRFLDQLQFGLDYGKLQFHWKDRIVTWIFTCDILTHSQTEHLACMYMSSVFSDCYFQGLNRHKFLSKLSLWVLS